MRLIRLNHLPMSRRRSHTTHTTQPSTDAAIRLIRLDHRPMSRRTTHTTRGKEKHIRRASRPPNSSLSIERSERFPDCLLEIPLATPWPKQTFRLATRTYSPTIFLLPVGSSLSIILVCVLSIAQPSEQPHSPTLTRPAASHPVAPVTISRSSQDGAAMHPLLVGRGAAPPLVHTTTLYSSGF